MRRRNFRNRPDRYPGPDSRREYRGNRRERPIYDERYENRNDNEYWRNPESLGMREFEMDRHLTGRNRSGYYNSRREREEAGTSYPYMSSNENDYRTSRGFGENDYYYEDDEVPESRYRERESRGSYERNTRNYHDQRTVDQERGNDEEWFY